MTQKHSLPIYLMIVLMVLAACAQPTPIPVFVTPTHEEAANTPVSTTVAQEASPTPVPTLPPTPLPVQVGPTMTFMGPLVGGDYVLPPTSTPRPSITPLPSDTPPPTDIPAASNTPVVAQSSGLPNLDANRMGIQLDPTLDQEDWNNAVANIQRLGLKWLKVQVSWKLMQPDSRGEVSVDFRRLEIYLETAKNSGLSIMVSVVKAPNWARTNTTEDGPPDDPALLAEFITLLLNEYGNAIDAVEIWNEPNLVREWQGRPMDGAEYMRLFDPAYRAVRAYSSTMTIITAGLAPTGDQAGSSVDDRTYLQQMYSAGLGNYPDVVIGFHPYGWGNSPDDTCCHLGEPPGWDDNPHFFFKDTLNDYRNIMTSNGHAAAQLWATEFGWATWDGFPGSPPDEWMTYNDRWKQAQYTIRAFQIGQEQGYMGPMFLWNLNFALLAGLIENRDERVAYSIVIPGSNCIVDPNSNTTTERPLYWMLYDAVRPDEQLSKYDCS